MLGRDRNGPLLPSGATADPGEIARLAAMAESWWDPEGPFRALHRINTVRLTFIRDRVCQLLDRNTSVFKPFDGLRFLDIGCGGGLLSEPVGFLGGEIIGIDATAKLVEVARLHAALVGAPVTCNHALAEDLEVTGERFDVILHAGVMEHVPDLEGFSRSCCRMLKPGGIIIVATLNRTFRSFLSAKIAGEHTFVYCLAGPMTGAASSSQRNLQRA